MILLVIKLFINLQKCNSKTVKNELDKQISKERYIS